ncbi:MAG: NAD(P)H-flavin reductase [Idiomarina sp.]|nr:NAD(P)H-flavin reductase [Idiomarina sp.]
MPIVKSQVRRCEAVNEFVYLVDIELPEPIEFIAGQYLMVAMAADDLRPFSIASSPHAGGNTYVQLHIGASPDNPYAWQVIERIRAEGELTLHIPAGDAGYRSDSERPLLLVAGGTGFSYTWSILKAHLASSSKRSLTLYWGVRNANDLYMHQELCQLAEQHAHFTYIPVIENMPTPAIRNGVAGTLIPAVLNGGLVLADYDVYIAGRFEMVGVARDAFSKAGLPKSQLFGDALAFI